jgi:hypothetical protein
MHVPQVPEPFMGRDERVHRSAPVGLHVDRAMHKDGLQDLEQLIRDLELLLVASLMEGDEDLVRQTTRVAWLSRIHVAQRDPPAFA